VLYPPTMFSRLAASLRRVTSSGRMIGEIDGLRFIAIATVILHHVLFIMRDQPHLNQGILGFSLVEFFELGNVGVKLFFGISGFILALPFAEAALAGGRRVELKRYYMRRLTRLEPTYIINLFALVTIALLFHGAERIGRIPHLLASLTYSHNFIYGSWSEINFVAWSLEIEAQFYIMAPILAFVFRIPSNTIRRLVLTLGMLGCTTIAVFFSHASYAIRMLLPFHLHFFLVGFLLADLYAKGHWKQITQPLRGADLLATVGIVIVFLLWAGTSTKEFAFVGVFLFYVGVLRSRVWRGLLNIRALVVYGGMCYTIYLYHFWFMRPVVHAIGPRLCFALPQGVGFLILGLVTLIFVGVVSAIPFVLFEKPFMYHTWPQWVGKRIARAWRTVR
jgi:peptidoglycan/LPS O-acetylase OafA/YrhL